MTEEARKAGVATQQGTQIHAGSNYRRVVELRGDGMAAATAISGCSPRPRHFGRMITAPTKTVAQGEDRRTATPGRRPFRLSMPRRPKAISSSSQPSIHHRLMTFHTVGGQFNFNGWVQD